MGQFGARRSFPSLRVVPLHLSGVAMLDTARRRSSKLPVLPSIYSLPWDRSQPMFPQGSRAQLTSRGSLGRAATASLLPLDPSLKPRVLRSSFGEQVGSNHESPASVVLHGGPTRFHTPGKLAYRGPPGMSACTRLSTMPTDLPRARVRRSPVPSTLNLWLAALVDSVDRIAHVHGQGRTLGCDRALAEEHSHAGARHLQSSDLMRPCVWGSLPRAASGRSAGVGE